MTEHIAFRASGWAPAKRNGLWKPAHKAALDSNDWANAYRFGRLDDHSRLQTWGFDQSELGDFAQVRQLEAGIDPDGDGDHLVSGWFEALEFLNRPGMWEAIESIAEELQLRQLTPAEVETLAAREFWSANVPAVDATSDS